MKIINGAAIRAESSDNGPIFLKYYFVPLVTPHPQDDQRHSHDAPHHRPRDSQLAESHSLSSQSSLYSAIKARRKGGAKPQTYNVKTTLAAVCCSAWLGRFMTISLQQNVNDCNLPSRPAEHPHSRFQRKSLCHLVEVTPTFLLRRSQNNEVDDNHCSRHNLKQNLAEASPLVCKGHSKHRKDDHAK
jgi:hypothetical protein